MSVDDTSTRVQTLKPKMILRVGDFLSLYQLHNDTDATVSTPFSDHPSNALAISFGSASIKSLTGETRKKWNPFFIIDSYKFYSTTLKAGKRIFLIHTRKRKSAGYLSSDIDCDQASYTYTYTHYCDPHTKSNEKLVDEVEVEKCVI